MASCSHKHAVSGACSLASGAVANKVSNKVIFLPQAQLQSSPLVRCKSSYTAYQSSTSDKLSGGHCTSSNRPPICIRQAQSTSGAMSARSWLTTSSVAFFFSSPSRATTSLWQPHQQYACVISKWYECWVEQQLSGCVPICVHSQNAQSEGMHELALPPVAGTCAVCMHRQHRQQATKHVPCDSMFTSPFNLRHTAPNASAAVYTAILLDLYLFL
eukprot:GHRR01033658.1.p1 GENE.GHRR01033658.1~~GHRR01033658.1.p1  ORF type:complete len:215 (+),score=28.95 GHRR01033658.1:77-721(+)